MNIFSEIMATKFAAMLLMFAICFIFIFFLRFLYGPKGILRKSLWKNIDDGQNTENGQSNEKN